jgi:hypothetical protein
MVEPTATARRRPRSIADLNQQEFVMRATRRQRSGSSVKDSPHFVEPQEVSIEAERSLKIFHIEDNMTKIMGFHLTHLL